MSSQDANEEKQQQGRSGRNAGSVGNMSEIEGGLASPHRFLHDNQNCSSSDQSLRLLDETSVETNQSGALNSPRNDVPFQGSGKRSACSWNVRKGTSKYVPKKRDDGNSSSADDSAGTGKAVGKIMEIKESKQERRTNINFQTQDSVFCYDICPPNFRPNFKLKVPLHVKNKEIRKGNNRSADGFHNIEVLRAGMFLLKHYISLEDQVKVIRKCKDLGVGPGGFYRPGYEDGAKLKLKMMCLGKNWDPETGEYGDVRLCDRSKPPRLPEEFNDLVQKAIKECHEHLLKRCRKENLENILPSMTPDICIVNFYSETGRLGLHQDKDESPESLGKGLPVVSFSIGDSAEFLYGDQRNVDKVKKIILESGDVLIFGGKARDIYHGVSTIFPDTAPNYLVEQSNVRPGRLNLTFREY